MVTYYSKEWLEKCRENLNDSERHMKKAKKLNKKWYFRVWDGPDGKDRKAIWEFKNGECINVSFGAQPSPWTELREEPYDKNEFVARFSCPHDMMAKLNKGEIGPLKALSSPDYQVEGSKVMIFKMLQGINSWNDHNAQIDCNYDFTKTDDDGKELS
ncbi:MAG: hypothetical protein HQ517_00755 [SAR324 cluster bacterium]|nr:hypothetical protein [SAR324 cluster bacterium]